MKERPRCTFALQRPDNHKLTTTKILLGTTKKRRSNRTAWEVMERRRHQPLIDVSELQGPSPKAVNKIIGSNA